MKKFFKIDGIKYAVSARKDGSQQVTRVAPYDDTEYHWAISNVEGTRWTIYRYSPGKEACTTDTNSCVEAAMVCKEFDNKYKLQRTSKGD